MGEGAEQQFYPDEIFEDESTGIKSEAYTVIESSCLLWLLDRCPLGCRVSVYGDSGAVHFPVSKAELRRNAAMIAKISPRVTLQDGVLYLDARVIS